VRSGPSALFGEGGWQEGGGWRVVTFDEELLVEGGCGSGDDEQGL
jgi:hypothetical protein